MFKTEHKEEVLKNGQITVYPKESKVMVLDKEIKLTATEYRLLNLFISHCGQVFTKKQIFEALREEEYLGDDNVIMVHISNLRNKIKDDCKHPVYIKTIKGLGYKMNKVNILFGIILFISIGMAIIYMSFDYEKKVRDGVFINIDSSEILKDEYTLKDDLNSVKKSYYSWMELLDNEGNVVDVKGNKRDSTIHYDNDELSKAAHRGDNTYYADILVFDDNNGNKRYCLIKYERDVLEFEGKFTSSRKYFVIKNEQGVKINSILYKGGGIFILLCIMDAAFLSLWINKKVKVPLKHIENGFLEIGTGNLDVQLNFRAEKEFEIIEEKFNSMVKMLKNSIRGYVTALDNGYVS